MKRFGQPESPTERRIFYRRPGPASVNFNAFGRHLMALLPTVVRALREFRNDQV
ncbi:hypothetical protein GGQ87_000086 [Brevundimonas alba]|uniref:Uncharacterized protein n=1 Tax=Brevundimonas alba TaxID=74314 RepID=A0A7X5YH35_9CAUL|nr:hypothetical protein [Brevundimonas alba]NJC39828.1 hypothetical protein [Brevundimonas alba]